MAYTKKTWKDRVSQYINRRKLTDINTGTTQTVTVVRDEGNVTEAGDTFTAANMNDLEDRIDNAFDALTAADISYSAGVSVADKIDDLTTVTTGTATLDSTYLNAPAEINNWAKVGRLVELHLTVGVKTTFASPNVIATGYPPPLVTGRFLGLDASNNSPIRVNMNAAGQLNHAYSQVAPAQNHIIELHLTYIAAN